MSIQTARLEFYQDTALNFHAVATTPHGTADFHLGPPDIRHRAVDGGHSLTVFKPTPDAKPKKVSAKRQKRASVAQETEVMELLGGRRHAGSGSVAHLKGDGRVRDKYRVEMKYTRKASYRVDRQELNKIRGECDGLEVPLFVMDFVDPITGGSPDRWVMVPFEAFQKLEQDATNLDRRPAATR